MHNSSSSVLVLIRTFLSLLHTYVVDLLTAQLFIAIQHTGNSYLHQHIPRKRLRASSQCLSIYCNISSCFLPIHGGMIRQPLGSSFKRVCHYHGCLVLHFVYNALRTM